MSFSFIFPDKIARFVAVFIYRGGRRESKGVKWYQLFKTGDTHFTGQSLPPIRAS